MPFKADLDRCPIDVPADTYMYVTDHSPVAAIEAASAAELADSKYESVISVQVTVPDEAKTLAELIDGVTPDFPEELSAENVATADEAILTYSGTLALPPGVIVTPGGFNINIQLTTGGDTDIADVGADGILTLFGTDHTGTVDYETGEWAFTLVDDTAVDDGDILLSATFEYLLSALSSEIRGLWMSPGAADEIYATYSENGVPTAATGILLAEPVFLAGQPNLIANAKFIGNDTLMDVEVMI